VNSLIMVSFIECNEMLKYKISTICNISMIQINEVGRPYRQNYHISLLFRNSEFLNYVMVWFRDSSACILCLFVATSEPSKQLKALSTYIVSDYVPMWFTIKTKSLFKDGARHLW